MRRAIASVLAVGIISTLLPVMPTTATAEAGEVQILHGWQVGGYGGTTFHLVTQKIGGYTAVREGDTIVLTSTGGGSGSSESILYSFPLGTVTRDDRIAALQQGKQAQLKFVDPLSRTYQPFPYYTDFSFVQWLTGTQQVPSSQCPYDYTRYSNNGCWVNPLIDISAPAAGSASNDQPWGGTGPLPSGLYDTQLVAYEQPATARLYADGTFRLAKDSLFGLAVKSGAINPNNPADKPLADALKALDKGPTGDGTFMEGTLYLNLRLYPPTSPGAKWRIHRWSYSFDLDSQVLSNPGEIPQSQPELKDDELIWEVKTYADMIKQVTPPDVLKNDVLPGIQSPEIEWANPTTIRGGLSAFRTDNGNYLVPSGSHWVFRFSDTNNIQFLRTWPDTYTDTITYSVKGVNEKSAKVTIRITTAGSTSGRTESAFDDYVQTDPETPVDIDVLLNDMAYLPEPIEPWKVQYRFTLKNLNDPAEAYFKGQALAPRYGTIEFLGDRIRYTPNPGVKDVTDRFEYWASLEVRSVDENNEWTGIHAVKATVFVAIGNAALPTTGTGSSGGGTTGGGNYYPDLGKDVTGIWGPAPMCVPGQMVTDYTEDLTRLLPVGDGRYQFITRTDRGGMGNYSIFVAEETIQVDRAAFRNYNNELAEYLAKTQASDIKYEAPEITTDILSTLAAAGIASDPDTLRLLLNQIEDINRALREATPAELNSLKSIESRVAFWTKHGIYDKYTPKEIQFMNKVAFPLAMVSGINSIILGAALGDGSAQLSIPSAAKTLSLVTVLEDPNAISSIWQRAASGQPIDPNELALRLTNKDTILKAINSIGLGTGMADTLKTAIQAASGSSNATATLEILAKKLDQTPNFNKTEVRNYLADISKAWGVPELVGEVDVEQYRQVMQILNEMACAGGVPTSFWEIHHLLTR